MKTKGEKWLSKRHQLEMRQNENLILLDSYNFLDPWGAQLKISDNSVQGQIFSSLGLIFMKQTYTAALLTFVKDVQGPREGQNVIEAIIKKITY